MLSYSGTLNELITHPRQTAMEKRGTKVKGFANLLSDVGKPAPKGQAPGG